MKTRNYSYNPTLDYLLGVARLARAGKVQEAASLLDEVIANEDAEDDLEQLDELQSDAMEEVVDDEGFDEEAELDDEDEDDELEEVESRVRSKSTASFRRSRQMTHGQKVLANLKALR